MKQRLKSQRALSTNAKITSRSDSKNNIRINSFQMTELDKIIIQNKQLKSELKAVKEININYAKLLNSFVNNKYFCLQTNDKRIHENLKHAVQINNMLQAEIESCRSQEKQLNGIKEFMKQKNIQDVMTLYQKCQLQTKQLVVQTQKVMQLQSNINNNKKNVNTTQKEQLRIQLKCQDEKIQTLEAKCLKLIDELEKSVKYNNLQKVQTYHTQIKLRQLQRRQRQSSTNLKLKGKENKLVMHLPEFYQ